MTDSQRFEPYDVSEASLDQAIADLLVISVMELRQAANSAFEPLGLNTFQVSLLNLIVNFPESTPSDLSRRIGAIPVAISTMLTQLEKRGLLKRSAAPADRRKRNIALTDEGNTLRFEANRLWSAVTTNRYADLNRGDRETILRLLRTVHSRDV